MIIDQRGKLPVFKVGSKQLVVMELDKHLVLMDAQELGGLIRFKKGSLTFRTKKGMKPRAAIKDLLKKATASTTEAIIIDMG